jgi:hypothetical protein
MTIRTFVAVSLSVLVSGMALAEGNPTPKVVRWEQDVRPAMEAAFCVVQGEVRIYPEVHGGEKCPIKGPDPTAEAVTKATATANAGLDWLFMSILEKLLPRDQKLGAVERAALETQFRKTVLADARLTRRYMPAIHAALEAAGAVCPDCPGPKTVPSPRSVTLDELMPYAVALVWPDRIKGPGEVGLHICTGWNGLSHIPDADLDLADAAFAGVFGNKGILPAVQPSLHIPADYPDAKTDEEKLALIRRDLKEGLLKDARFKAAVAAQLVEKAKELPVVCSDCVKAVPAS